MSAADDYRVLRFENLAQAMQEAQRLASLQVRTSGNFTLGQILDHLARAIDMVTGQSAPPPFPKFMLLGARVMMWVFKRSLIYGPARRGFRLPRKAQENLWSGQQVSVEAGLEHLQRAYAQFVKLDTLPPHPIFGRLTKDENHQLQCRHFEVHLGFVHPVNPTN